MTDNERPSPDDQTWRTVKSAWRDQPVTPNPGDPRPVDPRPGDPRPGDPAEPSALARDADGFRRTIRRRNVIEYGAFALVGLFFAAEALGIFGRATTPTADLIIRIGAFAVVIGVVAAAWQLHRRGSALAPETDLTPAADVVSFHRHALLRQRDALNAVGRWYLGPFLPGFTLMAIGGFIDPGRDPVILTLTIGFVAIVFLAILLLNWRAAAALQREIDALDRVNDDQAHDDRIQTNGNATKPG